VPGPGHQASVALKFALTILPALPWFVAALIVQPFTATNSSGPPLTLPAAATRQLADSLVQSSRATSHVWRDVAPLNGDGTVNAYIEIARGDRRKWEFEMGLNMRAIDRVMPAELGGYPVNYGFVPRFRSSWFSRSRWAPLRRPTHPAWPSSSRQHYWSESSGPSACS
jgi:hypothetical protein